MSDEICKHCGVPIKIGANNKICDHLYYPDNCSVCSKVTVRDDRTIVVSPMETIRETAAIKLFGENLYQDFEKGITEKNVYFLEAMLGVPRKFWLNLQNNYDELKKV